jgi:hypothetical protein
MTVTILSILLGISVLIIVSGFIAGKRYLQRLFDYDELFQYLQDDLEVNIMNFDKLSTTPLLSNAPEIVNASKLMKAMRDRLYEYVMRIEENALRERVQSQPPRSNRGAEEVSRS